MDLRAYIRLVRVHALFIIVCTLLGVGAAAALTLAATPMYRAQAQLFVATSDLSGSSAAYAGSLFTQQRVKSYIRIVDSPEVMAAVVNELGLTMPPNTLARQVTASAPLDTVLMTVAVTDRSPVFAQQVANATARAFTRNVTQLERTDPTGASFVKVSVVRQAQLPTAPVSPRRALNLALGLLVGVMAGFGGAVAKETLDQSVGGAEEIQDRFGLPTLGVIGFDSEAPRHPLVERAASTPRAEAFRQLRTNLQFADIDARMRSLVITSSVPEEGKTTTACNLALALAEAGQDVVLVEADLRRPRVGDYFGLVGAVGLTDVLIGWAELNDALRSWHDNPHIRVLLSGSLPPNPSEVLGSRQMAALLVELEPHGLVILDAPPLLPVTDAAVLARQATGALIVVAASTHRDQLSRAVAAVEAGGGTIFGTVLNRVPTKGPDAYRYESGYGYAAPAAPPEKGAPPRRHQRRIEQPVPVDSSWRPSARPATGVAAPALTPATPAGAAKKAARVSRVRRRARRRRH